MSTQTTTLLATLPRVNLLPPEIEQARRFQARAGRPRRRGRRVARRGALLCSCWRIAQVGKAQDDLDANVAQGTQLQAKVAEYAEVPLVYGQVEAAHAQLGQAMGQEVRWSYFLNDLSLKIPTPRVARLDDGELDDRNSRNRRSWSVRSGRRRHRTVRRSRLQPQRRGGLAQLPREAEGLHPALLLRLNDRSARQQRTTR